MKKTQDHKMKSSSPSDSGTVVPRVGPLLVTMGNQKAMKILQTTLGLTRQCAASTVGKMNKDLSKSHLIEMPSSFSDVGKEKYFEMEAEKPKEVSGIHKLNEEYELLKERIRGRRKEMAGSVISSISEVPESDMRTAISVDSAMPEHITPDLIYNKKTPELMRVYNNINRLREAIRNGKPFYDKEIYISYTDAICKDLVDKALCEEDALRGCRTLNEKRTAIINARIQLAEDYDIVDYVSFKNQPGKLVTVQKKISPAHYEWYTENLMKDDPFKEIAYHNKNGELVVSGSICALPTHVYRNDLLAPPPPYSVTSIGNSKKMDGKYHFYHHKIRSLLNKRPLKAIQSKTGRKLLPLIYVNTPFKGLILAMIVGTTCLFPVYYNYLTKPNDLPKWYSSDSKEKKDDQNDVSIGYLSQEIAEAELAKTAVYYQQALIDELTGEQLFRGLLSTI